MKNNKKIWLIAVAVILVIAVIAIVAVNAKKNQQVDPTNEGMIEPEATEAPQLVHVETLNYELTFDAQLAEMVFYREIPDTAEDDLEFYTRINEQDYAVFTLVFNSAEGDIVHMIADADGNKIPVAFMMNTLPEEIPEESADSFYIAQGVVNEVVASIKVN